MIRRWLTTATIEVEVIGPQDWDEWAGVVWLTWTW